MRHRHTLIHTLAWLVIPVVFNVSHAVQWQLDKNADQYQISIRSSQGDRLTLSHEGEDTQFIISFTKRRQSPDKRHTVQIWFDKQDSVLETKLARLANNTFKFKLSKSQKSSVINQMINHITLHVRYLVDDQNYQETEFSLLGFTAVLNDLLIAHDIGHLDPEWLNENHKTTELTCFYAANFSVMAMLYRKQGYSYKRTVQRIQSQYNEMLHEVISNIVKQVYAMPRDSLPRDPRGDKYGIFQNCMQGFNQ